MTLQHAFEQFIISFEGTANGYHTDFLVKSESKLRTYKDLKAEHLFCMFRYAWASGQDSVEIPEAPQQTGLQVKLVGESLWPTINGKEIPGLFGIVQETKVKKNGRTEDLVTLKIKL